MICQTKILNFFVGAIVLLAGIVTPIAASIPAEKPSCCGGAGSCCCCDMTNPEKGCGCQVDEMPDFPALPEGVIDAAGISFDLPLTGEVMQTETGIKPVFVYSFKDKVRDSFAHSPPTFLLNSSFII